MIDLGMSRIRNNWIYNCGRELNLFWLSIHLVFLLWLGHNLIFDLQVRYLWIEFCYSHVLITSCFVFDHRNITLCVILLVTPNVLTNGTR